MNDDIAIKVEGLSKRYELGTQQVAYQTFRDAITGAALAPFRAMRRLGGGRGASKADRTMWALRDINFEVAKGSVLGVVGRNGAGKSTLLKILARITEPTEGRAELRGRVGSLLEVGTGFHPELSGRENIYLNGAILGMPRADITRKFDQIVAFAEVEKFIDTPVKHYSSGMYLRLAFSVAAHLEPEILFVDEVLAVGDQSFQAKCLGKMGEVAGEGRTVLFVSHNMAAIRALCTEAMLLRDGTIAMRGTPTDVINQYLLRDDAVPLDLTTTMERTGNGAYRFTDMRVLDQVGQSADTVLAGEKMSVELGYAAREGDSPTSALVFHIFVVNAFGDRLCCFSTRYPPNVPDVFPASGRIRCTVDRLPLAPGRYSLEIVIKAQEALADHVVGAKTLTVADGDFWGTGQMPSPAAGPFLVDHSFEVIS
jgi:lipopolysaccharide transport system ATP-binding protein